MATNYSDVEKVCECGKKFIWTAGEQMFMETLLNNGKLDKEDPTTGDWIPGKIIAPKRCPQCRAEKKARFEKKARGGY